MASKVLNLVKTWFPGPSKIVAEEYFFHIQNQRVKIIEEMYNFI